MKPPGILIGSGIASSSASWPKKVRGSRILLVSEKGVFGRFGRQVSFSLRQAGARTVSHLLPSGEEAKTPAALLNLYSALVRARLGRDGVLVALGGGAVTDAAGFAAATYLRGIDWVSVPTTFLGQVDSGIGGKVGVNLPEGKNLIGAFHQPLRVLCDLAFLGSLPERERVSGLGEALKYGLVFDERLWDGLRRRWDGLLRLEPASLGWAVRACAGWKARVVRQDERETLGLRERLNFGHTVGHALEAAGGFKHFKHGEAVIWGMRAALALSVRRAGLDPGTAARADAFLARIPVPRVPREATAGRLWRLMGRDKKARAGKTRFVLLKALGRPATVGGVGAPDVAAALEAIDWRRT